MWKSKWEWLAIEPTEDKDKIRKAYAEQAKKYHPEEYPEEFKELQKAYKSALKGPSESTGTSLFDTNLQNLDFSSFGRYEKKEESKQQKAEEKQEETKQQKAEEKQEESKQQKAEEKQEESKQQRDETPLFNYGKVRVTEDAEENQIRMLLKQMQDLYDCKKLRNKLNAWAIMFKGYDFEKQFFDIESLNRIVDLILSFPRLPGGVQDYLYQKLFYNKDEVKYNDLMIKLKKMKRNKFLFASMADVSEEWVHSVVGFVSNQQKFRVISKTTMGRGNIERRVKKSVYVSMGCAIVFIITLICRLSLSNTSTYYSSPTVHSYIKQTEANTETYSYSPTKRSNTDLNDNEMYTKEFPYLFDVNKDGWDDGIYYDSDSNCFKVELFDKKTFKKVEWGTLTDYNEKYPGYIDSSVIHYFIK